VIGVSNEDPDVIRKYAQPHQLSYTLAFDTDDKAANAYGVVGYPLVVVIDKGGVVRAVETGVVVGGTVKSPSSVDKVLERLMHD
jgi:peroxiredoxin